MTRLIIIIEIIIQSVFIKTLDDIIIQMDYKVDDQISLIQMGTTVWEPEVPKRYNNSGSFIIKGKIGETLTLKILNISKSVWLASILKIGSTTFISDQTSLWKHDIPPETFSKFYPIEVKGIIIQSIGGKVDTVPPPLDNHNYTYSFTIPQGTYCSDALTDKVLPPNTFTYEEPFYYIQKDALLPLDFSKMIYSISQPTFHIIQSPWHVKLKLKLLNPLDPLDPFVELIPMDPYSLNNIFIEGIMYGQDKITYIATADGKSSKECYLNIIVCHPNCVKCVHNILPNDVNDQCTECQGNLKPYKGQCYDKCLPTTVMIPYSFSDCINYLQGVINDIKKFNKNFSGTNFYASVFSTSGNDNDNNLELADFKYCIERLRRNVLSMSNGEIIDIVFYTIDYLPIPMITYRVYDIFSRIIDLSTQCSDLLNFKSEDIKFVLKTPSSYFSFIKTDLPSLFNLNDRTIHLYSTNDNTVKQRILPNMTYINLALCEKPLKEAYNIPLTDPLYILVTDYYPIDNPNDNNDQKRMLEYHVFSSKGRKLNISTCESHTIVLETPIDIEEEERLKYEEAKEFSKHNINVYDPNDPFFNDICVLFPLSDKDDVPRKDRVENYLQSNDTQCPSSCSFININYTTTKANCKCPKSQSKKAELTFDSIKENLINSLLDANYEVVLCYMLVFDIDIFLENIGSWVMIGISIILMANICLFMIKFVTPLKEYLAHMHQVAIKKHFETNGISNNNNNEVDNKDIIDMKAERKKSITIVPIQIKNKSSFKTLGSSKRVIENINDNHIELHGEIPSPSASPRVVIHNRPSIIKLSDDEYNEMNYKTMVQKDKRNLLRMYWGYLKECHSFINSFFINTPKVLRTVKISKFLINLMLDLSLSAFFYWDKYISNNNNNGDFLYNLPISMYSYICTICIIMLLNVLTNSEREIVRVEGHKEQPDVLLVKSGLFLERYKWRVIVYFVIQVILMGGLWYYVAAFCSVYQNSQTAWIKSSGISTGIGMVMPFGICLIFAIMRKICIWCECKWLYKILSLIMCLI